MNKEIFYVYRCKNKCPYSNPLIKTMLYCVTLCVPVLSVSIDCAIDTHLLYLVFV